MKIEVANRDMHSALSFNEAVLLHSPLAIGVYAANGQCVEANHAYAKLVGATREALLAQNFHHIHFWETTGLLDSCLLALASNSPQRREFHVTTPLGATNIFECHIQPAPLNSENHLIIQCIDLTEAKAVEQDLRNEKTHLRALLKTIPDLVWLKDPQGVYLNCNQEFERYFGAREADIVGKTDFDFVDAELAGVFRRTDSEVMATNQPSVTEEWSTYVSDGYRALLEKIKTPMCDASGAVIGILGIARDITARRQAENALRANEEKLRSLYELSPLGIALTDMQGRYIEFNKAFMAICGYSEEALKTLDYWSLTPKKYADDEARQLEELEKSGRYGPYEKEYRRKDGSLVPLHLNGMLVTGADGTPYIWSIVEDITEKRRTEAALQQTMSELSNLITRIPAGVYKHRVCKDGSRKFDYVSQRACDLFEISMEDIYLHPDVIFSRIHPDEIDEFMRRSETVRATLVPFLWEGRMRDGMRAKWLHIESFPSVLDNGDTLSNGVVYDITNIKEHEEQLDKMAHYDALTGTPNRMLLADRMRQAIAQAQRNHTSMGVTFLDLDGFKQVNDVYGHEAGDKLLIEIARRLCASLRGGDTVARIGGDEFVLLTLNLEHMEQYAAALHRILEIVSKPIDIGGHVVAVSASLGASLYPKDGLDSDILLRHADEAMYRAKQGGKNKYEFFTSE